MSLIEKELADAFSGAVKRKVNKTPKLRAAVRRTAKRVVTNSAEVMVKITGFGKGGGHVKAHLHYISRKGEVELENDRGDVFSGKAEVNAFFKGWEDEFSRGRRHQNQRDTLHMVLSMPERTDPDAVRDAVRAFAKDTFAENHEYVFALHTDEPHPHCHLTVKMQGVNGKRLNPRKADLQAWRESFAENLLKVGVDATATPRPSRGVVKKAESSVVRHIERGDKTHKPRVSRARAAKVKEAADELTQEAKGLPVAPKAWEEAITAKQKKIRAAWLAIADAIERAANQVITREGAKSAAGDTKAVAGVSGAAFEDIGLVARIRAFVAAMPAVETERQQLKRALSRQFSKQADRDNLPNIPGAGVGTGQKIGAGDAPIGRKEDLQR